MSAAGCAPAASARAAPANPMRGEVAVAGFVVRPSFAALVAAEGELGSLFALVERAGEGRLTLGESAALLWHCRAAAADEAVTRAAFAEALAQAGLAAVARAVRVVMQQVVQGG